MQEFYSDLRHDVETVLCSPFVDDSCRSMNLIREDWRYPILSALGMIVDGDDCVDDATGVVHGATDNATAEVDEVLDKILDNAIEGYGSSARYVYGAIFPFLVKKRITDALSGQK
jgi:hypothetical protein